MIFLAKIMICIKSTEYRLSSRGRCVSISFSMSRLAQNSKQFTSILFGAIECLFLFDVVFDYWSPATHSRMHQAPHCVNWCFFWREQIDFFTTDFFLYSLSPTPECHSLFFLGRNVPSIYLLFILGIVLIVVVFCHVSFIFRLCQRICNIFVSLIWTFAFC